MSAAAKTVEGVASPASALWEKELEEHRRTLAATTASAGEAFERAVALLVTCIRNNGKVLVFGNGGSASDAQHITAELVVRYKQDRKAIAAVALTSDTSTLTACANDLGYDEIFARQIEALGAHGDVALAISTSGKSSNVIRALQTARGLGLKTVGLTGGAGGRMLELCDAAIVVPTEVTARIQEMHITIGHLLCKSLEEELKLV